MKLYTILSEKDLELPSKGEFICAVADIVDSDQPGVVKQVCELLASSTCRRALKQLFKNKGWEWLETPEAAWMPLKNND